MKKFLTILVALVCLPVFGAQAVSENLIDSDVLNKYYADTVQFTKWFNTLNQDDKNQVLADAIVRHYLELAEISLQNGADANTEMISFGYTEISPTGNYYKDFVYTQGMDEENRNDAMRRVRYPEDVGANSLCRVPLVAATTLERSPEELVKTIELLLKYGADINAYSECGHNAFELAVRIDKGVPNYALTYLLDRIPAEGLNPEIATGLVTDALINEDLDLMTIYNKYGLKISPQTVAAGKALVKAIGACCNKSYYLQKNWMCLNLVRDLISKGTDVNISDDFGWTALHNAMYSGDYNLVKSLLERGAKVNVVVADKTPLQIAIEEKEGRIAQLLRQYGARE